MTVRDSRAPSGPRHPIQVVARRTGLSADVIRVWERRYRAVSPRRTGTNRRLYSDADVERLVLLRRATLAGRAIGSVAHVSLAELLALVEGDEVAASKAPRRPDAGVRRAEAAPTILESALSAVRELDAVRLRAVLNVAAVDLGAPALLEQVLAPLLDAVGEAWRCGTLRIHQEHLASALVRSLLEAALAAHTRGFDGPELLVATPAGDAHELGALMIAVLAAAEGWRVTYLGGSLPLDELAAAARARGSRAVALSIVFRAGDPDLVEELRDLRRALPGHAALLVGGRAAGSYAAVLSEIGAAMPANFAAVREELARLRTAKP